jgi:hypothetical protein
VYAAECAVVLRETVLKYSSYWSTATTSMIVGTEFTIERERRLVPVVETNCWEFRGCFRYENFSRIFDPNRTRISYVSFTCAVVRVRTERQLAEEEEEDEEEEDEEDTPADISVMQAADLQGYLDFDGDIQSGISSHILDLVQDSRVEH